MRTIALMLAAGSILGCSSARNERSTLGPDTVLGTRLPAYPPAPPPTPRARQEDRLPQPVLPAAQPKWSNKPLAPGLEARSWEPVTLTTPVDGTWHKPVYAKPMPRLTDPMPRRDGKHPTNLSATDIGGEDGQIGEAALAPVAALRDFITLPFRLIWVAPWREKLSPNRPYDRATGVVKRIPEDPKAPRGNPK